MTPLCRIPGIDDQVATEPLARDEVSEILSEPGGAASVFDFIVLLGAMVEGVFFALLLYTCEYIQKPINLRKKTSSAY